MMENPFTTGIAVLFSQIRKIAWGQNPLSALIQCFVYVLILILFIFLWPYGLLPVFASSFWGNVGDCHTRMKKSENAVSLIPFVIIIGVFFSLSMLFHIVSIPLYLFMLIGAMISPNKARGKEAILLEKNMEEEVEPLD